MGLLIDFFCLIALFAGLATIKRTYHLWPLHIFLVASQLTNMVFFYTTDEVFRTNIYTRFAIVQNIAFIIIFRGILKLQQYLILIFFSLFFYTSMITNDSFANPSKLYKSINAAFPALIIVAGCMLYFFNLIKSPYARSPFKTSSFWIVLGLLFRYLFVIPIIFWGVYLDSYDLRITAIMPLIVEFTYILLYICLTNAFICKVEN